MADVTSEARSGVVEVKTNTKTAFDTKKYLESQATSIKKRAEGDHTALVVEFGGKICQDRHAARVLPGYHEDAKLELVQELMIGGDAEPVLAVSSKDILEKRIRGDFRTTYDEETVRTIIALKDRGLNVRHIALTRIKDLANPEVKKFIDRLKSEGMEVHTFFEVQDYPKCSNLSVDLEKNSYIDTGKKTLLVLSPGGGSGKFNVCLSQLFNEMKRGNSPNYIKLETFPVHNLSIDHPVHFAFMAACADFFDEVVKDNNYEATSYNRDQENYALLREIGELFGDEGRHLRTISSATNMGINRLLDGFVDEETIKKEAAAEVARRMVRYAYEYQRGEGPKETFKRAVEIMNRLCQSL